MTNNEQMIPFWQTAQHNNRYYRQRRAQQNACTREAMRGRSRNTAR